MRRSVLAEAGAMRSDARSWTDDSGRHVRLVGGEGRGRGVNGEAVADDW